MRDINTVIETLTKMQEVSGSEVYKYMIDDLKIVKEQLAEKDALLDRQRDCANESSKIHREVLKERFVLSENLKEAVELLKDNNSLKEQLKEAHSHLSMAYRWGLWLFEDENFYDELDEDDRDNMMSDLDTVMKFLNSETMLQKLGEK